MADSHGPDTPPLFRCSAAACHPPAHRADRCLPSVKLTTPQETTASGPRHPPATMSVIHTRAMHSPPQAPISGEHLDFLPESSGKCGAVTPQAVRYRIRVGL